MSHEKPTPQPGDERRIEDRIKDGLTGAHPPLPESPTEPEDFDEHWQELEDLKFRASLIQVRLSRRLTIDDVSQTCGLSKGTIRRIEDFTYDPHLSVLRRYSHAVGAVVQHRVGARIETEGAADAVDNTGGAQ